MRKGIATVQDSDINEGVVSDTDWRHLQRAVGMRDGEVYNADRLGNQ